MDVTGSHTYAAPIDDVLAILGDPEATKAKYKGMGHRDIEVQECAEHDGLLHIRSSRVVDVELPGFAKRFLKPTNTLVQSDEWRRSEDGIWDGRFDVEVHGSPMHLSGTMHLRPGDGVCTHDVDIAVAVKVPLVGGRIAEWAGKGEVRRTLDAEFAFNEAWLAAHHV